MMLYLHDFFNLNAATSGYMLGKNNHMMLVVIFMKKLITIHE